MVRELSLGMGPLALFRVSDGHDGLDRQLLRHPQNLCHKGPGSAVFVVHPLAPLWRRFGPIVTYVTVGAAVVLVMWGMYSLREPLLRVRFGVRAPLVVLSCVLFAAGMYVRAQVARLLSWSTIFGLPEVSASRGPGHLVTEGIYSRVRHPRYVGIGLGILGGALFSNYLASYLLAAAYLPGIYAIVLLEERELRERFGSAYVEYRESVPRFFPRLGARRTGGKATPPD